MLSGPDATVGSGGDTDEFYTFTCWPVTRAFFVLSGPDVSDLGSDASDTDGTSGTDSFYTFTSTG